MSHAAPAAPPRDDKVTVTTVVALPPAEAFAVFTEDVDVWWRRGPRYRFGGNRTGVMRFEPRVGGRLLEVFDEAAGDLFEVGRVRVWEPGARLVVTWRAKNFAAGEETEVEVRFEPVAAGTRVRLEHRGFASLRPDHPVRHGLTGEAFTSMIGLYWADLLAPLRTLARRP